MSNKKNHDVNNVTHKDILKVKNKFRYSRIFSIRFALWAVFSIVPSMICFGLTWINANDGAWMFFKVVAFAALLTANWIECRRFAIASMSILQYYLVNCGTWAIYCFLSIFGLKFFGFYVYSMCFAGLRFFEFIDGVNTLKSVIMSNICLILVIIASERVAAFDMKRKAAERAEDAKAALSAEVADTGDLWDIEIEEKLERGKQAVEQKITEYEEDENGGLWDKHIAKGDGTEIVKVTAENIDADIDENDFIPADIENSEYNKNKDYSDDALWNSEIYEGRERDDAAAEGFFDEKREALDVTDDFYDDEPLWNIDSSRSGAEEDTDFKPMFEDDDLPEGKLWNDDAFKNRKSGKILSEYEEGLDTTDDFNSQFDADRLWDLGDRQKLSYEEILELDKRDEK